MFQELSQTDLQTIAGVRCQVVFPSTDTQLSFLSGFEITSGLLPVAAGGPIAVTVSVIGILGGDLTFDFTYPFYNGAQGYPGSKPFVVYFKPALQVSGLASKLVIQLEAPDLVSVFPRSINAHGYVL